MSDRKEYHGLILPDAPLAVRGEKASGFIIMDDGNGPVEVAATLACGHCGKQWIVIKGSGRTRGFCLKCYKPTCGASACFECVPFEKRMDEYEKGLRPTL